MIIHQDLMSANQTCVKYYRNPQNSLTGRWCSTDNVWQGDTWEQVRDNLAEWAQSNGVPKDLIHDTPVYPWGRLFIAFGVNLQPPSTGAIGAAVSRPKDPKGGSAPKPAPKAKTPEPEDEEGVMSLFD